ncbi:MAG: hypothetical protein VXX86_00610 [Planctomycetota bacterium]|nr:hypothetical protein [Planctomycetota bacterium]
MNGTTFRTSMVPTSPGPADAGFAFTPEVGLLLLGILATVLVAGIFIWLLRGMIREDARERRAEDDRSGGGSR